MNWLLPRTNMKKLLFVIVLLLVTSVVTASTYYVKIDNDGYVVDLTAVPTSLPDYHPYNLAEPVSAEHLRGYYKLVDGYFVIDETKRQQWLASQVESEEPEQPEGE